MQATWIGPFVAYHATRVPLRHRDQVRKSCNLLHHDGSPARRLCTTCNWSGPLLSPCCQPSALAGRKHCMATDIDATKHNICVTATDPAHRFSCTHPREVMHCPHNRCSGRHSGQRSRARIFNRATHVQKWYPLANASSKVRPSI